MDNLDDSENQYSKEPLDYFKERFAMKIYHSTTVNKEFETLEKNYKKMLLNDQLKKNKSIND
ncbi:hypothetical protein BpHYR1_007438 [Brachionus plicatilis]|uniref:Uncharacterized protein n=1 Tax=Brachionus plicatilis TaxID=10195 RepID=A0A3M7PZF8_BRAPC|nr:hypothetical protein BpHYR1_007438 [Brachionus plicatilis]